MGDAFYSERQANSSGFHSIYTIIYLEDTWKIPNFVLIFIFKQMFFYGGGEYGILDRMVILIN